ncbi:hypothetical protein [Chondromyces apiculatus]|uniref:Uncharacterized protein n=1 Tax=Chondromyces apiculatus DSM 436 TaxID=1192034 RepID=A0A017SUP7_9BACT|nr:hypothetical protein [Chondromyces apiculatus]EYF00001.1 Hypothetical protein CAP_1645 [Chondromyces apiculatus DSM 436]
MGSYVCGLVLLVAAAGCARLSGLDRFETDSTSTGGGGNGGSGGGTPAECVPSLSSGAVDESCGVWVSRSRGDDGNDGSRSAPMASLHAALEKAVADKRRVYACAEVFVDMNTGSPGIAANEQEFPRGTAQAFFSSSGRPNR